MSAQEKIEAAIKESITNFTTKSARIKSVKIEKSVVPKLDAAVAVTGSIII